MTIELRDGTGAVVGTTITNPDGSWDAVVTPAVGGTDYYVTYAAAQIPAGLNALEPTNMTDMDGDGAIDKQYVLTGVMPDEVVTDLDFGFDSATPATGTVTGTVYLDARCQR